MRLHIAARKTHKWLGLFIGLQVVIWSLSGLYMTVVHIDTIHGDHLDPDRAAAHGGPDRAGRPAGGRRAPQARNGAARLDRGPADLCRRQRAGEQVGRRPQRGAESARRRSRDPHHRERDLRRRRGIASAQLITEFPAKSAAASRRCGGSSSTIGTSRPSISRR